MYYYYLFIKNNQKIIQWAFQSDLNSHHTIKKTQNLDSTPKN
jgi:hypothetical protein